MPSILSSTKVIDPALATLFASSTGPVKPKTRIVPDAGDLTDDDGDDGQDSDETTDVETVEDELLDLADAAVEANSEDDSVSVDDLTSAGANSTAAPHPTARQSARSRKRKARDDDLEARYFEKLEKLDASANRAEKKRKSANGQSVVVKAVDADAAELDANDIGDDNSKKEEEDSDDNEDTPVHESVEQHDAAMDITKDEATRTVYLANVSTEAVVNKSARKTFLAHLRGVIDADANPEQKLEKLRFRSLPVSSVKLPKRAAFITKSVRDATTKAVQAYAIYSTQVAARNAAKQLNGTIVLDRHLRADLNAHPDEKDHRRCVYIGNLNFVDDDTSMNANGEEDAGKKKKTGVPADIEEGLWRTFSSNAGPVEFVRVPRDPKTRVGKGFAYVQFESGISVEKALLLNGKKFPPMLPRPLRVTRCKDIRKTARAVEKLKTKGVASERKAVDSTQYRPKESEEQKTDLGRAARLLGKGGAGKVRRETKGGAKNKSVGKTINETRAVTSSENYKTPEQFVFEGQRASIGDGKPSGLKFGKGGRKTSKPGGRGIRRAAAWRKSGGNSAGGKK